MAHPWSLVDAKYLELSPVCCSLAGAVDGLWQPGPVLPYGYAIHRVSQVKSIPVCACPVIDTQCKRIESLLSWGGRSYNSLLACFVFHMRNWEDCWSESCYGSKFTWENQKPGIVNTLRESTAQKNPDCWYCRSLALWAQRRICSAEQSCSRAELLWISWR